MIWFMRWMGRAFLGRTTTEEDDVATQKFIYFGIRAAAAFAVVSGLLLLFGAAGLKGDKQALAFAGGTALAIPVIAAWATNLAERTTKDLAAAKEKLADRVRAEEEDDGGDVD